MNADGHRDKEILLAFTRKCTLIDLYKNPKPLTTGQQRLFKKLLVQYQQGCPLAYLTRHQEFVSMDFIVNRNVLIPRPETELVVEEALRLVSRMSLRGVPLGSETTKQSHRIEIASSRHPVSGLAMTRTSFTILDIGTGSGNIAVSLARCAPVKNIRIFASDISRKALRVARQNARRHQVHKYVRFYYGDLFSAFPKSLKGKTDIIISNPPYVSPAEYKRLPLSVREYEPRRALWAGQNGLEFYRKIVDSAPEYLKPGGARRRSPDEHRGGHLIMEMGYRQSKAVREILARNGSFGKIYTVKDYQGIERVIIARYIPISLRSSGSKRL